MSRTFILFIIGLVVSVGIYAAGFNFTSYEAVNGYVTTVEEFSVCKDIKNAGTATLFVPTKSLTEWERMYNNPPAGITVSAPMYPAECCASQCPTCTKACSWAY